MAPRAPVGPPMSRRSPRHRPRVSSDLTLKETLSPEEVNIVDDGPGAPVGMRPGQCRKTGRGRSALERFCLFEIALNLWPLRLSQRTSSHPLFLVALTRYTLRKAKLINESLLAQARQDLQARAAAVEGVQFFNVPPRDFDFADIRGGFGRGHLAGWLRQGLGNHLALPVIYRLTAGTCQRL